MSLRGQPLQDQSPTPDVQPDTRRSRRWRWPALVLLIIALVGGGWWAWPRFIRAGEQATQSATGVIVNTANNSADDSAATAPVQAVAQTQPIVERATERVVEQQSEVAPTAAAITTTQSTSSGVRGMVVIAGTDGATLWTTPGGEQIGSLGIGDLVNATGRSEDGAWLYGSSAAGVAGWVAADQIVAFGTEKLPVITVTVPALAVANEPALAEDATLTATTAMSAAMELTAPVVVTATTGATATVLETVTETGAETTMTEGDAQPDATGVTATVIVNGARLNIRSGPSTRYGIIGKANRNEEVTVLARNAAADWVQIALPDSTDGIGWVAAFYLRLSSAVADLPISAVVSAAPALAVATTATTTSTDTVTTTSADQGVTISTNATQPAATQPAAVVSASPATGLSGTLVFQSSPGGMIYGYNLSTGRLWQLTNGFDPAISPDGQRVAFVRTAGENGVYLINIDGSNERLIFSGRNTLAAPKWSPDGNYIVFTRGDEYIECRDLGRGMCLSDERLLDQNPDFPVDNYPLVKIYESNLARVDTNGGNYRDIATLESARAADWNEAGIVYQSKAGLQITADEADAINRLVTHDPLKPAYEDPDWQPNGGKILFVSRSGNHREIYAVNPDGSGMVALTKPVTTLVDELPNNVAPAWSPDGQYIVFLSNRGADNSAGAWKLWVMDANGSNQHPLPIDIAINYTYGNEQLVGWGR